MNIYYSCKCVWVVKWECDVQATRKTSKRKNEKRETNKDEEDGWMKIIICQCILFYNEFIITIITIKS